MRTSSVPYSQRLILSIPEVMRWTGLSREAILGKLARGEYLFVMEGKRRKVLVKSVLRDLDRRAAEAAARVNA